MIGNENILKRLASIILDDPLLREDYGFLNYRKLLDLMDRHNFHTTIAFIPWNYNRTDKNIATLFRERPDRFSLCVHGCDHTGGEFAKTDYQYLEGKIRLATTRMTEHEKRTGIPFDRVMVFPQGKFSNEAMEGLKRNHYLAAVNTEKNPVNGLLSSDFPLFIRYRPEDMNASYNPAFVVVHHDYFRDGYKKMAEFVDRLNASGVKWESVGNIIRRYVSTKETNDTPGMDLSGLKVNGYKECFKIAMRRYASEFRDNHLSRNGCLLKCVENAKRKFTK